jgi:hypothetical protein
MSTNIDIYEGPGFYYHYKHDPAKGTQDYAYEVLNVAHHTEMDDFEAGKMIVYRPLYESAKVYKAGKHWDVRPYDMFLEDVEKDGYKGKRFTKIINPTVIAALEKARDQMYK